MKRTWFHLLLILMLVASVTPIFLARVRRGEAELCQRNLKNIGTALETYSTDCSGRFPPSLGLLTERGYFKSTPTCPTSGADYAWAYESHS